MCILLTTSAHHQYPFILISNRDEYYRRATSRASFSHQNPQILAPFDLAKPTHGSWIGVTKQGRVGVLVNYRDTVPNDELPNNNNILSRGSIVTDFLTSQLAPDQWQRQFAEKHGDILEKVGGFSFLFGVLDFQETDLTSSPPDNHHVDDRHRNSRSSITPRRIRSLKIISNRGGSSEIFVPSQDEISQLHTDPSLCDSPSINQHAAPISTNNSNDNNSQSQETIKSLTDDPPSTIRENKSYIGLSNSLFLSPWPKVLIGENLLTNLIINSSNENWGEQKLIKELFKLLSFNCFKKSKRPTNDDNFNGTSTHAENHEDDALPFMESVAEEMKSSIFIPPLKTKYYHDPAYSNDPYVGDYYGTRTQTIILLRHDGQLTYIERTLHELDCVEIINPNDRDVSYSFNIFKERKIFEVTKLAGEPIELSDTNGKRNTVANGDHNGYKHDSVDLEPSDFDFNDAFEDVSNYADDETSVYSRSLKP
ncbi:hypothetical protein DASC09_045690 [Saccharomycopsis crataegensis]|uniref:DUF833-domain-containing protein n=1 Tax=Saccharomycopsis crataegensis TaxID=43959 RepID=A0AAV5QS08_9ASCO|nr:hypothetical protein DASC09_045690 [Saccharomycopsis crataegensis]